MAESEHDDLADALNQLAGGEIAPSETEPPAPVFEEEPAHLVQPASSRPQIPLPPAARPPIPARSVSSTDAPGMAQGISESPAAVVPPASAARVTIRAATPVVRQARPIAPTLTNSPTDVEMDGDQSTALSGDDGQIVDDEDLDIIPMPDVSQLAQTPRRASSPRLKAGSRKHLEFRRTMIPILFTCGIVMFSFASLKYVSGDESSLAILPVWVAILLVIAGAIVLALAVVNMLAVKAQMENNSGGNR